MSNAAGSCLAMAFLDQSAQLWHPAFDSDDEECSDPIEDEHHANLGCSAYADAREQQRDPFQSHETTVGIFPEPASVQWAGQVPHLDQDAAYEQSLV